MYESFFGLRQAPFSIAPDPSFLYMSAKHQEALTLLNLGLIRGASFVLLTGEIGAGKTTVWRRFLEDLPSNFDVANVVNPKLDVTSLLERICGDLDIALPESQRAVDLIDALHGHLLLAQAQGRRTLIMIDEAQALSMDVLEQLRLLTNLDSSGKKLQVMLIGQPELRQILDRPELEPLAQRVVARYHLPALSEAETAGYIVHRLKVAGLSRAVPFDSESISMIHRLCRGVPRRINTVCDRALAVAAEAGLGRIDRQIVEQAAVQVYGPGVVTPAAAPAATRSREPAPEKKNVGSLVLLVVVALAAGFWLVPRFFPAPAAVVAAKPATPASTVAPAPAALVPAPVSEPLQAQLHLDAAFGPAAADEAAAWRALAGVWGTVLGAGEPCAVAAPQSLQCLRSRGGLASLRQADRPGWLKLSDERGRIAHVLLVALADDSATLNIGGADVTVPLLPLARLWRGEFGTFWRAPPGYRDASDGSDNPQALRRWLQQRLAALDGQGLGSGDDAALRTRIAAFQLTQGLVPDGVAGPLTLMQLGRVGGGAGGADEPRLLRRAGTAAAPITSGNRPS